MVSWSALIRECRSLLNSVASRSPARMASTIASPVIPVMSLMTWWICTIHRKRLGNRILDWRGLAMPRSPGRRGQVGDALNRGISQAGQHVAEIIADLDLESAAAFHYR